ncbi:tetratricopeptide repeat protein [Streptomyces sp. NPDC048281]|uniref:tetratricopeptide repeat protein n=1 Tax=Streptomyces sp. NPDC048281 TaxID=3154715 RepID=UPI00342509B1
MHGAALPRRPQDFVGRDCLLDEDMPRALSAVGGRPVVLRSTLGSGATATAVEYLHRVQRCYADIEWIEFTDPDTAARLITRALHRFRSVGGRTLLAIDGVSHPSDVAGLLPVEGPDTLLTSAAAPRLWLGVANVLEVAALSQDDAVRLLRRYQPGLSRDSAARLADRLDYWPPALAYVGSQLAEGMSAESVLAMPHSTLLHLLAEKGGGSPAGRISAAFQSLAPTFRFAQDLLSAFAVIGTSIFPTRCLGRSLWYSVDEVPRRGDEVPHRAVYEALEELVLRGLVTLDANGGVEAKSLVRLVAMHSLDDQNRPRIDRLVEALLIAFEAGLRDPNGRTLSAPSEEAAECFRNLDPALIRTPQGRCAMLGLVDVLLLDRRFGDAHRSLTRLRDAWERQLDDTDPILVQADRLLARAHHGNGNHWAALLSSIRALGTPSQRGLRERQVLADCFAVTQYLKESDAKAAYLVAMNVREHQERWLGEADPDTLRTASFIARTLLSLGYCVRSAELGEKIWQIQIEVLGEEHRETLVTLHHLALALAESGVAAQRALEYFETAMTLRRKTLGDDHFETASSAQAYITQSHRLHDGPPSV